MKLTDRTDVWLGRAHVRPDEQNPDALDGAIGAYVNVMVIARSHHHCRVFIEEALNEAGFIVDVIEDIYRLDRLFHEREEIDPDIIEMAEKLGDSYPVHFCVFNSYYNE